MKCLVIINSDQLYEAQDDYKFLHYSKLLELKQSDLELLLDDAEGLLILGGPQHIPEIEKYPELFIELQLLEIAIRKRIFIMGICLGFQLINYYFGNTVRSLESPCIGCGFLDISTFSSYADEKLAKLNLEILGHCFSFHYDGVFENKSSELQTVALSNSGLIYVVKHVDLPIYGVQFHPELSFESLHGCLKKYDVCANCMSCESVFDDIRKHFFEVLFEGSKKIEPIANCV